MNPMATQRILTALTTCLLLTSLAQGQAWQPLFDGQSFDGWVNQKGEAVEAPAWEVADGMLHLDRSKGAGGNLLTDREYGDFELIFEWKVAPGANNGIKYRVNDFDGKILGLEYQVIDDFGNPELKQNHKTASIYDVYDAADHSMLNPADVFNRGRILVQNNRIEHWLNGKLITSAEVGSETWTEKIANSKFADVPGFGATPIGRIMLTDHKDEVWYRNIFIRDLGTSYESLANATTMAAAQPRACCCPTTTQSQTARRRRGLFGMRRSRSR